MWHAATSVALKYYAINNAEVVYLDALQHPHQTNTCSQRNLLRLINCLYFIKS